MFVDDDDNRKIYTPNGQHLKSSSMFASFDFRACLTFQGFTLHEVEIVGLLQNAVLESPAEAFEVPVVDVEHVALHVCGRETPADPRILDAGPLDAVADRCVNELPRKKMKK